MTVFGSQLILAMCGELEQDFSLTPLRKACFDLLFKKRRATITELLKDLQFCTTGGTYKSVKLFFLELEMAGYLTTSKQGRSVYWTVLKPIVR